jgi:hypothetical protein
VSTSRRPGLAETKLQLSKGYLLKFDQLARLLNASCQDGRSRVPSEDLAAAVGVATVHVQHLGSITQALGLIQPITYTPTELGRIIREQDTFFDDLGTLWHLHYVIGSEPRYLVWNRFANVFIPTRSRFTGADFRAAFDDLREGLAEYSGRLHINKETRTILDAYTEQNFSRLAYIRCDGDGYARDYREQVPPLVLAAAIARFRDRHRPGDTGVSVTDLLSAPNSPGVVFQLSEDRFRSLLEQLKTEPGLSVESRADLDQVRLTDGTPDSAWMERYYARR